MCQLADIVASTFHRACKQTLQKEGWNPIASLFVNRRKAVVNLIAISNDPHRGALLARAQNEYFTANCKILASEEVVICPNVLLFRVKFGFPLLGLFGTLNASARTSIFCASRTAKVLVNPRSNSNGCNNNRP